MRNNKNIIGNHSRSFLTITICAAALWMIRCTQFEYENPVDPESGSYGFDIDMVYVEGGKFTMGCTEEQGDDCHNDESPAHGVTLGEFYIMRHEVTQKLWRDVMGLTIQQQEALFEVKPGDSRPGLFGVGDDHPIYYVSWNDVQEFIARLNAKKTGRTYRLPTEAEWEYAARGGKGGAAAVKYKYAGSDNPNDVAWYWDGAWNETTQAVGGKMPNGLGIYDMSGNVWEWVQDRYGDYPAEDVIDPVGSVGFYRVARGGSWTLTASSHRVTYRGTVDPAVRALDMGFRLAASR